jgi:[glutamine synthetase] adenylyltransferase / [glutamine synthetase]-adenylyl-L-tyrosine phosphorylase
VSDLAERLERALAGSPLLPRFQRFAPPFLERRGKDAAARDLDDAVAAGLARTLAGPADVARYLALRPELFERIARATPQALEQRSAELERLAPPSSLESDLETFLDALRLLRRDETAYVAVLDLGGQIDFERASVFLSTLAETCVRWALRAAEVHSGAPSPSGLSAIGMGKIAGRELTYHSDLDLIFLYPDAAEGTLAPTRVAQRLIAYLSTMTGAGTAYAVDARLRPSGRQGTLVSTSASFRSYQLERAATWEHLALVRARPLAGEIGATGALLNAIRLALLIPPRPAWPEIDAMRMRVERQRAESGGIALKTGPGGLMDVEFLAAGGLLERGPAMGLPSVPRLIRAQTRSRVERLEQLLERYAFLRRVESRSRWLAGRATDAVATQGEAAARIADLVAPGTSAEDLARDLERACTGIREAYRAVIDAGSVRALLG